MSRYSVEIPALQGEMGELSIRPGRHIGQDQTYPTWPILNDSGEPVFWLRHIYPTISESIAITKETRNNKLAEGTVAERIHTEMFQSEVLESLRQGKSHNFLSKLGILKNYGVQVAPSFDFICTVNELPSLLRITPHVDGVLFSQWLHTESVPEENKRSRVAQHVAGLSAHARDAVIGRLEGKTGNDSPFFFDSGRLDQYIVAPNDELIMIDTGDESAHVGDNIEAKLFKFHVWLAASGIRPYMDDETHQLLANDLDTIHTAFEKAGQKTDVTEAIEMEYKYPGYHLD